MEQDLAQLAAYARPPIRLAERRVFARNLAFLYRLIEASEHLLLRALVKTDDEPYADWLREHFDEEKGHAEMLKEDLKELGVVKIPEFFDAAMIAGSQYYFIEHRDPALLLGYMAVLEGHEVPEEHLGYLEEAFGPMRCLRLHCDLDPGHFKGILKQIERLPVAKQKEVEQNAVFVAERLRKVLEKLNS